jgi:acyl-CoA thioester hydrolase
MSNANAYPSTLKLRLDWSELDLYGHINNVSFFKYLQASRVNYWEMLEMERLAKEQDVGPILASTHCDFRKPLYYPGGITIKASIVEMRSSSFTIYHQILNVDGDVAAEGRDVVVLYSYQNNNKYTIPAALRARIEELEGRKFAV